jgi:hypothetical protein
LYEGRIDNVLSEELAMRDPMDYFTSTAESGEGDRKDVEDRLKELRRENGRASRRGTKSEKSRRGNEQLY